MTSPKLDASARAVDDPEQPAAAPTKKLGTKKAPAKKGSLKAVGDAPTASTAPEAEESGKGGSAAAVATDLVADGPDGDPVDVALEDLEVDVEVELDPEAEVEAVLATDVVLDLEAEEVVLTVGKKRTLDDVDESTFEPAEEAKLEGELTEDQGFTLSEADDADEPEQQVMAAGATADPVKDYLKQIGKVALLNAEQEVELAKRIEAGLFADEKINDESHKVKAGPGRRLRVDRRGRPAGQEPPAGGQPAARGLPGQALHRSRHALPGPDPGGQPRPDPGGGEVRLHQGLQVLHVRDVVDPAGDHPGHGRPGPDHPDPGAHGRGDQQAGPGAAPDAAGPGPRAQPGGAGPGAGHDTGEGRRGPEVRPRADLAAHPAR